MAIDVDSGDFELADDLLPAANRLLARRPEAQVWFVRIGHCGVHRFGFRRLPEAPLHVLFEAASQTLARPANRLRHRSTDEGKLFVIFGQRSAAAA